MRSMKSLLGIIGVMALALALAACSDDDKPTTDGGNGKLDKGTVIKKDGTVPPPTKLTCSGDLKCKDLVMSRLIFPDATTATKIGVDFNGDDAVDNALGSILGALSGMTSSLNLQESIDETTYQGGTMILLRLEAKDFTNEAKSAAQAWLGAEQECCTSKDLATCKSEAMASCFSGSYTHYVADNSPTDAIFGGTITGGNINYGSMDSTMTIQLPITDAGVISLSLKAVHLMGKLSGDTITDGILAGAVTKKDLDENLLPTIAKMLDDTLNDPNGDQTTKDTIKTLFDTNPEDGHISTKEVADNSLIKTFLAGDVDVDGDGQMELSLGIAFEAVGCTINETGTPPDSGTTTPDTGVTPDSAAADAGTSG